MDRTGMNLNILYQLIIEKSEPYCLISGVERSHHSDVECLKPAVNQY